MPSHIAPLLTHVVQASRLPMKTVHDNRWSVRVFVYIALLLMFCPALCWAKWEVDEHDACVWVWTPAALLRGPIALATLPTVPPRLIVGMGLAIGEHEGAYYGVTKALLFGPLLGVGVVLVETLWATAETVTGGYYPLLKETEATVWRLPLIPTEDRVLADPCGRVVPCPEDKAEWDKLTQSW